MSESPRVVVYGIPNESCSFCKKAKTILTKGGIDFEFVDVSKDQDFFNFFKKIHKTVPQIYVDGVISQGGSSAANLVVEQFSKVKDEEEEEDFEW